MKHRKRRLVTTTTNIYTRLICRHLKTHSPRELLMITLELDDETATLLTELVRLEHLSPAQLLKKMLHEHMEDYQTL